MNTLRTSAAELRFFASGLLVWLPLCGCLCASPSPSDDGGLPDAGSVDAGSVDAGSVDAGSVDAGSVDAGTLDGGPIVDGGPLQIHSPCLDAGQVVVVPDVADGVQISMTPLDGRTYDMRGVDVRREPMGAQIVFTQPQNFCVTGAATFAQYPPGFIVDWPSVKLMYDVGGIFATRPQDGTTIFDRVYIEGTEDGLMMARNLTTTPSQRWELRHSYLKNIIDDAIENDGYRSGIIDEVLSEGTHIFYSARNPGPDGGTPEHTLAISNSVIGFACKPDPRTDDFHGPGACPAGSSTNYVFKLSAIEPQITMSDTVIHHPAIGRSGPTALCMPAMAQYRNVTLVWTGTVPYPCPPLPGVTVTQDAGVYLNARAAWLARHGCRPDGTQCAFLRR